MGTVNRFFFFILVMLLVLGVAPPALADSLGQSERFNVNTEYDALGAARITATLRAVGTHAYWYVDDRYWSSLSSEERTEYTSALADVVDQFDSVIYPRSRELFGSEPLPGIDGDPRVTILLQDVVERSGGYYETRHYYAKSLINESNEREMVFVSAESVPAGRGAAFTAHEFQHLISFSQKEVRYRTSEDTWLNEARSEYAVTNAGLNNPFTGSVLQRRASSFIRSGSDSLVLWPNTSLDYAMSSLFIHYVAEQYGSDVVARTLQNAKGGVAALNLSLASEEGSPRFWEVFRNWLVAASVNNPDAGDVYAYQTAGLDIIHVNPEQDTQVRPGSTFVDTQTLEEWQPVWYELSIPRSATGYTSLSAQVDGESGTTWVAAITGQYADGSFAVYQPMFRSGRAAISVPLVNPATLVKVYVALGQGLEVSLQDRSPVRRRATLTVMFGDEQGSVPEQSMVAGAGSLMNGDLMSYAGAPDDTYVVWDGYRRYLPPGVLELYGFQDRLVHRVSSEVFFSYRTSNYIRTDTSDRVYAVRPEGSRHWLHMSAEHFLSSGRDPGAIFTVNEAEATFYSIGEDVTR